MLTTPRGFYTVAAMMTSAALARLIEQEKSLTAFAKRLRVSRQTVYKWLNYGVPADRVPWLVARLRGNVTAAELRPDLAHIFREARP